MKKALSKINQVKEMKCPKCGNKELVRCSFGGLNCPNCFTHIQETKKERLAAIKRAMVKINPINYYD
jgi:ribosomal protein L37AE/L43A